MRALVTGAAGFVGSHLAEALVAAGHDVVGVDAFTPFYDPARKRANLAALAGSARFSLVVADLRTAALGPLVEGADAVFHLAGQPGVRSSWAEGFRDAQDHNVLATARLLEAVRRTPLRRFVLASSSSVYGTCGPAPAREDDLLAPESPYGATKAAAEHLCSAHARTHGVPTVALRYFSLYGPRQRPDMAFSRFVEAALAGEPLLLHGAGAPVRDFTYVSDAVAATLAAADAPLPPGAVLNVAGGARASVAESAALVGRLAGVRVRTRRLPPAPGDAARTAAATDRARRLLGWAPAVGLEEGLAAQVAWHRGLRRAA